MKQNYILLVLIAWIHVGIIAQCDNTTDYSVLRALYISSFGDSWGENTAWPDLDSFIHNQSPPPGTDMSLWHGVTCKNGRVTELDLFNNGLTGEITSQIGLLEHLEVLDISFNTIEGALSDLSSLTNLEELNIAVTEIEGDLSSISGLTAMRNLLISTTQVGGNLNALSPLLELERLSLQGDNINGDLSAMTSLTALNFISIRETEIVGDISSLESLVLLNDLRIVDTNVSGFLSSFELMSSLSFLILRNTMVGGNIRSLRTLPLFWILLSDSPVIGNISVLSLLPDLSRLDLSNTEVSGNLDGLKSLVNLEVLNLENLNLTGCWPASFEANCTSLTTYNFEGNLGVISNQGWQDFCADRSGMCPADCLDDIAEVCNARACALESGFYHAADSIYYSGFWRLLEGNQVILNGGGSIGLTDGFEVAVGGELQVETTGCSQD